MRVEGEAACEITSSNQFTAYDDDLLSVGGPRLALKPPSSLSVPRSPGLGSFCNHGILATELRLGL